MYVHMQLIHARILRAFAYMCSAYLRNACSCNSAHSLISERTHNACATYIRMVSAIYLRRLEWFLRVYIICSWDRLY
jgi:hypothetical protein